MTDFRNQFFLKSGSDTPEYPPLRFRLPNGQTRYSYDCTQEDLESVGYEGPYPLPPLTGNQTAKWDNQLKKFVVVEGSDAPDPVLEDNRIRAYIRSIVSSINNAYLPNSVPEFLVTLNEIKKKAYDLLNSTDLLTESSLPLMNLPAISTVDEIQANINLYPQTDWDKWKYTYETYGFVGDIDPSLSPYFTPPSGWSITRSSLQNQTITVFPYGIYSDLPSGDASLIHPSGTVVISGSDPNYGVIISLNPRFF